MRLVWLALGLALAAATVELIAGPGHRLGWWPFTTGFSLLRYGAIGALLSIPLLAWAAWRTPTGRRRAMAGIGLLIAMPAALLPLAWLYLASTLPVIHDISTDTNSPPSFVAVLPLRQDAPNSAEYGGPQIAAQQREAYPDIAPLRLALPPAEVFVRALDAARRMDWQIVAADEQSGTIEATATTFLFGFKDDVVVRIVPDADGSKVDVRSVSRVGRSDVGTNARRIRDYLKQLQALS